MVKLSKNILILCLQKVLPCIILLKAGFLDTNEQDLKAKTKQRTSNSL